MVAVVGNQGDTRVQLAPPSVERSRLISAATASSDHDAVSVPLAGVTVNAGTTNGGGAVSAVVGPVKRDGIPSRVIVTAHTDTRLP